MCEALIVSTATGLVADLHVAQVQLGEHIPQQREEAMAEAYCMRCDSLPTKQLPNITSAIP
jgi:hypothetical protein